MKHSTETYINFKGGIASPGDILSILEVVNSIGVKEVSFGLRQQMIIHVPGEKYSIFEAACFSKNISFEKGKKTIPSIVSSYAAANILTQESWLREGVYKDIFDLFTYTPRLKVNIVDSLQNLVPFFTGNLNWLSSPHQHFWYLYVRFPGTEKTFCWPELVYTNDIAFLSKKLEKLILSNDHLKETEANMVVNDLFIQTKASLKYISKTDGEPFSYNKFYFPNYEGLNKHGENYWLGIYRRSELFSVSFLTDVCNICLETKIGQLYTTPWKSIIIKGINKNDRHLWDFVLGKYRINVQHSANELNWQVEDGSDQGLVIKRNIIRHFDKEDVRTCGLSFAVETTSASNLFGSVIIRLRQNKRSNRLKSLERYDILHTKGFNPNSKELILYRENVEKDFIGTYLVSLCKLFYENESTTNPLAKVITTASSSSVLIQKEKKIFQCRNCLTIYNEAQGDTENEIPRGTPFDELPKSYCCPLCAGPKEDLLEINEEDSTSNAFKSFSLL